MNQTVPGDHPDQDVLADLAAEALPLAQAREVEAHVMACPECERLLADAEYVRTLLGGPDPGPMPDDVWARIETGLAVEAARQTPAQPSRTVPTQGMPTQGMPTQGMPTRPQPTRGWFDAPASPDVQSGAQPDGSADGPANDVADPATRPIPTVRSIPPVSSIPPVPAPPPSLSFEEAPTAAWKAFLSEPAPPPPEPVQQRVGRAVRSMRSRRDVRTDEPGKARWNRPGVILGAAAAGVVLLGLGGLGLMTALGGDPATTAADALPGVSGSRVLHASGVDYTASTLADRAKALVGRTATASAGASAVPLKPGTVAEPARLAACLGALGEGDRQPIAVDLARYQGREAAVIVLPGRQGGFDVWVVARDCRPGAEGHLAYKSVPA